VAALRAHWFAQQAGRSYSNDARILPQGHRGRQGPILPRPRSTGPGSGAEVWSPAAAECEGGVTGSEGDRDWGAIDTVLGKISRMEAENDMAYDKVTMRQRKKIALVAHDNKKKDLMEWARFNRDLLAEHELYSTGVTGKLLEQVIDAPITKFQSGPLGGDQEIGAKIAEGEIDFLIFFWDPLEPLPHDPDVRALLRIAVVWNIPVACNRASADFMISSSNYSGYRRAPS